MAEESPYLIGDVPGFTPQIARLVCMMKYARRTTLDAVRGLDVEELDHLHDDESNSIGMLLAHIAAVEFAYRVWTMEDRQLDPTEWARWGAALELGPDAREQIRGSVLDVYLADLAAVRASTLEGLAARSDEWLELEAPFWYERPANNYFKWFHVLEASSATVVRFAGSGSASAEIPHPGASGKLEWRRRNLAAIAGRCGAVSGVALHGDQR